MGSFARRGRRGLGLRKHGLERWATIWMDENFGYYDAKSEIEMASSADEETIEELQDLAEEWQDIGSRMGGTVFLDCCLDMAYSLASEAFSKAAQLQAQLDAKDEAPPM